MGKKILIALGLGGLLAIFFGMRAIGQRYHMVKENRLEG